MKNKSITVAKNHVKNGINELHRVVCRELPIGMTYAKGESVYKILQHGLPFGDNPKVKVKNLTSSIEKWIYVFPHIVD
jgi:hypothetical protein